MAREPGFEFVVPGDEKATFFPLNMNRSTSASMQIIDRCTQLPLDEFEELLDDPRQWSRGPILMAMLGLSIHAARPTWSTDRIMRIVDEADWANVELTGPVDEETVEGSEEDPLSEKPSESNAENGSLSQSDESLPSSTPEEPTTTTETSSEPSKEIPA